MTTTELTAIERLQDQIGAWQDGLAEIAGFFAENPHLVVDTPSLLGARLQIQVGCGRDAPAEMAKWAKALAVGQPKGAVEKKYDDHYLRLTREFGAVTLEVWATRDLVCERVVVGTETVEVPDPDALAAVPTVPVEREVVEWRCSPLLADGTAVSA